MLHVSARAPHVSVCVWNVCDLGVAAICAGLSERVTVPKSTVSAVTAATVAAMELCWTVRDTELSCSR